VPPGEDIPPDEDAPPGGEMEIMVMMANNGEDDWQSFSTRLGWRMVP